MSPAKERIDVVRSAVFEVTVWPDQGGKIASLRAQNREWLIAGRRWSRVPASSTRFIDVEVSGWDEMLPTIDPCDYRGHHLADHGEAWSAPWQTDSAGPSFKSPSSGCELRRTIKASTDHIRVDYTLTAEAQTDVLWAAHPLFVAPPGTRVVLPTMVTSVLDITGQPTVVEWANEIGGIDSVPAGEYRKYVIPQEQPVGWAAIVHPGGIWLRFRWPVTEVPYLALYLDQQAYAPAPCIAIEPMMGWYDSLARAVENGTARSVDSQHSAHWWIEVDSGSDPDQLRD